MAMELTENAIALICKGDVTNDNDMMPIVQVSELKLVASKQQPQQQQQQRFRMVLSDGSLSQQGMLATQKNDLVTSGLLQIGSVIRLTKFTCNVIQNRMIVIVMDLEVLIGKCDPIGKPIPAQRPSPAPPQPPTLTANTQSFAAQPRPSTTNPVSQSFADPPVQEQHRYSRMNQTPGSATYVAPPNNASRPEFVAGSGSGSFKEPNTVSRNPRIQVGQPRVGSFSGHTSPMYSNRGPAMARSETLPRIIPIAALNPYQGKWTIKARVTSKAEIRHYHNSLRGDGKVFHFDLLDCDGGEIRATCFNAVADQFYHQIEAGKVYFISRGSLKPAQKAFNHLRNDLEIFLDTTTMIQQSSDDDNSIPRQQFYFCPINDIEAMENSSIVDVIGVVSFISPAASITRKKDSSETQRRTLHLRDVSGRSVELTLWGNFCNVDGQRLQDMCDAGVFPVLAVKSGRVSDFNGKTVGTISTSQLFIEPDFPEAKKLKEWYDKDGKNTQPVSISRESLAVGRTDIRKTISQIKDEGLGTKEKPDWITVSATVIFVKFDNFCYTACPIMLGDRPCNKKVTNNGDGKWHCERCDQSVDECEYRYILQLQIQDHTGLTWVTAFQECGEEILGISAKDLYYLKYVDQNDERFAEVIRSATFTKYLFKLKVKEETFSDEQRVKSTVVKAEKYDHTSDTRLLLDSMDRLKAGDPTSSALKAESNLPNPGMTDSGTGITGSRQPAAAVANYVGSNSNVSRESGLLANQVGPYGNQYRGSRFPAAGTEGVHQYCTSCGAAGHHSINCPSIMSGPGQSVGGPYTNRVLPGAAVASGECYKCHKNGHWARDCPGLDAAPAYGSSGIGDFSGRYGGAPRQQVGGS